MTTPEILKAFCEKASLEASLISDSLIGVKVRIISNYNGQIFGSSRKSMKDSIQTIREAYFDGYRWCLFIEGKDVGLGVDEVEFL